MSTKLITLGALPKEVEKLVDAFSSAGAGITEIPIEEIKPDFELRGKVTIDFRNAKARYRNGALEYGPVETLLYIQDFRVKIDWHKALNIPKEACIKLEDPCGHTIFKECWHWDLGVSEFVLLQNVPIPNKADLVVLDVSFRDPGADKKHFELTGDIPVAGQLFEIFVEGFARGAIALVGKLVERLLTSVLGNGEIARLFISLIKKAFRIIDRAMDFVGDIARISLQPLDELLHKIFKDKLEVVLQKEGFPKTVVFIDKTAARPEVGLTLLIPPSISIDKKGLTIEILR